MIFDHISLNENGTGFFFSISNIFYNHIFVLHILIRKKIFHIFLKIVKNVLQRLKLVHVITGNDVINDMTCRNLIGLFCKKFKNLDVINDMTCRNLIELFCKKFKN